jgi:uncharacterized OB-fold protein
MTPSRRAPQADLHSASYWEGLRAGKVVVQCCRACGLTFFPHLPTCPRCASREVVDQESGGTGTVYSWVRVHRALSDEPVVDPPYAVVTVDLDGGGRVFGRLEPHDAAGVGLAVRPRFVDHGDWTELVFEPRPIEGAGS